MTLTEVLELRERDPLAFNRLVAEKVMGIVPREVRITGSTNTVRMWTSNPYFSDGCCDERELKVFAEPKQRQEDARADLEVHRAACQWPSDRQTLYYLALEDVLLSHIKGTARPCGLRLLGLYVVGDYAAAALAIAGVTT